MHSGGGCAFPCGKSFHVISSRLLIVLLLEPISRLAYAGAHFQRSKDLISGHYSPKMEKIGLTYNHTLCALHNKHFLVLVHRDPDRCFRLHSLIILEEDVDNVSDIR